MDVLKRIDVLKEARGWSEYQLSLESGLTQSTISSWYRSGSVPGLFSLECICRAFGITLSQFFMEENEEMIVLSEQQKRLIRLTWQMPPEKVEGLMDFLRLFLEINM